MEPITTALIAGAAFILKGLAGAAVKDAYDKLKSVLADRLSSLTNLEEDPDDDDYAKAVNKEIQKRGLSGDPDVLAKASALNEALEKEPADKLAAAKIDVTNLKAAQDVIVKRLQAGGDIIVKDIEAKQGKIEIEDISAGVPGKN